jgi:hypothetical protein
LTRDCTNLKSETLEREEGDNSCLEFWRGDHKKKTQSAQWRGGGADYHLHVYLNHSQSAECYLRVMFFVRSAQLTAQFHSQISLALSW